LLARKGTLHTIFSISREILFFFLFCKFGQLAEAMKYASCTNRKEEKKGLGKMPIENQKRDGDWETDDTWIVSFGCAYCIVTLAID
jgi:hypothetical protein